MNTLKKLEDGRLLGDNTDGAGLVADLLNAGVTLSGRRILLLGAGGAVRGVLEPLLAHRPAALVIANRTASRAEQLVQEFAELGPLSASGFAELAEPVDLIVNGIKDERDIQRQVALMDEMIGQAVMPFARAGIVSSVMLALGRALGETMAVALVLSTGGFQWSLIRTGNNTIAAEIALNYPEAFGNRFTELIAAGFVLFIITLIVNLAARAITARYKEFSGAN